MWIISRPTLLTKGQHCRARNFTTPSIYSLKVLNLDLQCDVFCMLFKGGWGWVSPSRSIVRSIIFNPPIPSLFPVCILLVSTLSLSCSYVFPFQYSSCIFVDTQFSLELDEEVVADSDELRVLSGAVHGLTNQQVTSPAQRRPPAIASGCPVITLLWKAGWAPTSASFPTISSCLLAIYRTTSTIRNLSSSSRVRKHYLIHTFCMNCVH